MQQSSEISLRANLSSNNGVIMELQRCGTFITLIERESMKLGKGREKETRTKSFIIET
jgi:hypothetical protein